MAVSRRGILGGIFAAPVVAAVPVQAIAASTPALPAPETKKLVSVSILLLNHPAPINTCPSIIQTERLKERIREAPDGAHYDIGRFAECTPAHDGFIRVQITLDQHYRVDSPFTEAWFSINGEDWTGTSTGGVKKYHTHTDANGNDHCGNQLSFGMLMTNAYFDRLSGKPLA